MLPGGLGPVAIPILLLLGWYQIDHPILRFLCLTLLVVWFVAMIMSAVFSKEWSLLIFPMLVIVGWFAISGVNKSFGPD